MYIYFIACFAFALLYLGTIVQIWRIISRQDSASISLWEIFLRLFASTLLLVKMFAVGDQTLTIGQGIWVVLYTLYIIIVIFYKNR